MDIKEFIENFIDQFDDAPEVEITPETRFHELEEWSSMIALSVMAMIDEEYDIQIKADEMRNSKTVQDLYDCVVAYL